MNLNNPMILNSNTIPHFLETVSKKPEIGIYEREGYTLIAYNVAMADTFDSPEFLECRGLCILKGADGWEVLRRPLDKFFNVGEREDTLIHVLKEKNIATVTEKADGAQICPLILNDTIIWGTKRVAESFHKHIDQCDAVTDNHRKLVRDMDNMGLSPIFEFHDPELPESVIVIRYKNPFLMLLQIRDKETGVYLSRNKVVEIANQYKVPVTGEIAFKDLDDGISYSLELEGEEGFVIAFDDGTFAKLKSPWYVKRHKLTEIDDEKFSYRLAAWCLDGVDDVLGSLPDIDSTVDEILLAKDGATNAYSVSGRPVSDFKSIIEKAISEDLSRESIYDLLKKDPIFQKREFVIRFREEQEVRELYILDQVTKLTMCAFRSVDSGLDERGRRKAFASIILNKDCYFSRQFQGAILSSFTSLYEGIGDEDVRKIILPRIQKQLLKRWYCASKKFIEWRDEIDRKIKTKSKNLTRQPL